MLLKHIKKYFIFLILLIPIILSADRIIFDGQPYLFLLRGVDARANAMGNAYVSLASDATSTYWNPAGLTRLDKIHITTYTSNIYLSNVFNNYLAIAQSIEPYGVLGVGMIGLATNDMDRYEATPSIRNQKQGKFSTLDLAVLISYAFDFEDVLSVGGTLKGVREQIDSYISQSFTVDVGFNYKLFRWLYLGGTIKNLLPLSTSYILGKDEIFTTPTAQIGAHMKLGSFLIISAQTTLEMKIQIPEYALGLEYRIYNDTEKNRKIYLRLGSNPRDFSTGIGIQFGDFNLDLAYLINTQFRGTYSVSMSGKI